MDSPLLLLKQEINQTLEQEHDLAKWKLAAVATLGATGLGLSNVTAQSDNPAWLLLFIPFVCAYIDLYAYQYGIRIQVLARFLREHGDQVLKDYENTCDEWRKRRLFSLGGWAGFGCSLVASVIGPLFHLWSSGLNPRLGVRIMNISILLVGVLTIVSLRIYFKRQCLKLEGKEPTLQAILNLGPGHKPELEARMHTV
jgi:hypothetical protein